MNAKWIILAVAMMFVGISVAAGIWYSKTTQRRKRNAIQRQCAGTLASGETILVNILSFNQPRQTAMTITNIFNSAACPLRVYVAIYEVFDDNEQAQSVVDMYASECKASTSTVFCLKDHIRTLRVPTNEQKGVLVAMDQLERHLLHSETFVCTMQPGARLCANWDNLCISSWRSIGKEKAVLTTVLQNEDTAHQGRQIGGIVPGTYTVWNSDLSLSAIQMKKNSLNRVSVRSIAWSSSFSFTSSLCCKALPYASISIPDHDAKQWCTWMHDILQSIRYVANGWSLYHPHFAVGYTTAGLVRHKKPFASSWQQEMLLKAISMLTPDVAAGLGWSLSRGNKHIQVNGRGQLGLHDANDVDEVDIKLGSIGEMYSLQARLELPTK
jgi:hypothetical protein